MEIPTIPTFATSPSGPRTDPDRRDFASGPPLVRTPATWRRFPRRRRRKKEEEEEEATAEKITPEQEVDRILAMQVTPTVPEELVWEPEPFEDLRPFASVEPEEPGEPEDPEVQTEAPRGPRRTPG
jgi:hypothetical protein